MFKVHLQGEISWVFFLDLLLWKRKLGALSRHTDEKKTILFPNLCKHLFRGKPFLSVKYQIPWISVLMNNILFLNDMTDFAAHATTAVNWLGTVCQQISVEEHILKIYDCY